MTSLKEKPERCVSVMQPERAEFDLLALRGFAEVKGIVEGKIKCDVTSSSGL